jgi:hypothetical protein
MFGLKYPSLLQFDTNRREKTTTANLAKLYGIESVLSDTQMRTVLDPVKPNLLHSSFTKIHRQIQRHKILEKYKYLGGYIVTVDGTGQFDSKSINCKNCGCKTLRNGEEHYYHQLLAAAIVHPDKPNVFPLFPEAITHQDGSTKNDCERNAAKGLLPAIREAFPQLNLIVVEDALSANAPHIRLLNQLSMNYIIVAKPSDHTYMVNIIEQRMVAGEGCKGETIDKDGTTRHYRFINQVPLNASNQDLLVNYLEYWEITSQGEEYHNTWITNIELRQDNVYYVMRAGRACFQIENETFNTLKNQGYNLEHNYGHGEQYLATVLAMLMMLHFLIDQVQEVACPLFKAARGRFYSRIQLWETLRSRFLEHLLPSWEVLWNLHFAVKRSSFPI